MTQPTTRPRAIRLGSGPALAIGAVVAANLMWGASVVAAKVALDDGLPPLTLGLARSLVALAVLLPLARRAGGAPVARREVALLGVTGVGLFFVFSNLGILLTSATSATLILDGGEPVAGALLAVLLLRERLGLSRLIGAAVALGGIALVVQVGRDGAGEVGGSLLGDGLMVASVLSWAAYLAIGRRVFAGGADPITVVAHATLVGALFLLPAAAIELAVVGFGSIGMADLLLLLYLGIGCTALTDVLLGYGLATDRGEPRRRAWQRRRR